MTYSRPTFRSPLFAQTTSAFTLVELLVAMAVLVLLVAIVSQMVSGTSATVNHDTQRLDTDSEARLIFDRMAGDLAGMVRRPDVDCTAYYYNNLADDPDNSVFKRPGNDSLFFYSEAPGYMNTGSGINRVSPIAILGYRIWEKPVSGSISPSYSFERWGSMDMWDNTSTQSGLVFLAFDSTGVVDKRSTLVGRGLGAVNRTSYVAYCHAMGTQSFRLEFCYLLKDGTFWTPTPSMSAPTNPIKDMRDVSAVVATIALLDNATRVKFPDVTKVLDAVVPKLQDGDTPQVASQWANTLLTDSSIPLPVRSNARVYQRYFYLR